MKKLIVSILIIIFILLFIRFVIGGPEDDWICVKGEWAKHGNPSAPKPTGICSKIK